jgi:WD40 repeat protein
MPSSVFFAGRGRPQSSIQNSSPCSFSRARADKEDTSGRPVRSLLGHKERVTSVAYSPDGKSVATVAFDGTARIWDATDQQP